jgi:hypothetical protein
MSSWAEKWLFLANPVRVHGRICFITFTLARVNRERMCTCNTSISRTIVYCFRFCQNKMRIDRIGVVCVDWHPNKHCSRYGGGKLHFFHRGVILNKKNCKRRFNDLRGIFRVVYWSMNGVYIPWRWAVKSPPSYPSSQSQQHSDLFILAVGSAADLEKYCQVGYV